MDTDLAAWSERYARSLLEPLGARWAHVEGVAQQARRIAPALPGDDADRVMLLAGAYLHDIGYAPDLAVTGFHPLDGARHLRTLGQERLAGLVAFHSGARYEAEERGLAAALAEFPDERSVVSAALAYSDMITGPTGAAVSLEERIADVAARYGEGHAVTRSLRRGYPELAQGVEMVQSWLRDDRLGALL